MDALVHAYWRPVFKHIRLKWRLGHEDAADLTQAFFLHAIERSIFDRYDSQRARFRTFVRLCVDRFTSNSQRAKRRIKRGGDIEFQTLDFALAERELVSEETPQCEDVDVRFHREWLRSILETAVEELRLRCQERGNMARFAMFRRYDLNDGDSTPNYAALAAEFGTTTVDVTNQLAAARRDLRASVHRQLREQSGSDAEAALEAHDLFRP